MLRTITSGSSVKIKEGIFILQNLKKKAPLLSLKLSKELKQIVLPGEVPQRKVSFIGKHKNKSDLLIGKISWTMVEYI